MELLKTSQVTKNQLNGTKYDLINFFITKTSYKPRHIKSSVLEWSCLRQLKLQKVQ